jgi:hypothetical protein
MGLTIHYSLKSNLTDAEQVQQAVHHMHQLALDLPFEQVGRIVDLRGRECDYEDRRQELQENEATKNGSLFWLLIQARESVCCPWNKRMSMDVLPERIIGFDTWPGPGSESANFGLCLYPAEVEWEYTPEDDLRFQSKPKPPKNARRPEDFWYRFDWKKWNRYCMKHVGRHRWQEEFKEKRKVPTGLAGWHWRSFCKTQYASDPSCGGIPNFLRCHISVITLLDRIAKIPGVKTTVEDEGRFGSHLWCPDWREADAEGRKRVYRRHKGLYNPAALAKEVGEWNQFIAGFAGALSDALAGSGMTLEAPIKEFADFERLEFRGRNQKHLAPFLQAMKALAQQTVHA